MPKGKAKANKGTHVTLEMVEKAMKTTVEGRHKLTFSSMGLTVFPKCLLKFSDLDELDLSRNQMVKLPDDIGNLLSLKRLDLHSNNLECLPETIGKLKELTYLNVSNNGFTNKALPSTLGSLLKLEVFHLGINQLTDLPASMKALQNLTKLDLSSNMFKQFPECVRYLPRTTQVIIKNNPIRARNFRRMSAGNVTGVNPSNPSA